MKAKTKKGLKIFFITLGSVLGVILAFLIFMAQASFSFIGTRTLNDSHSNFLRSMVEQNPVIAETPVTKIAILGAHDSLSYDIGYNSIPNSSQDTYSNNKWLYYTCRGFIARQSKTQMENVYKQLKCGVRYIDARITNIGGVFYTSHGLVSGTLEKSLLQILQFLNENPGEYIFFHIVYYYPGQSSWAELDEYMASIKYGGKSLFDYVNYNTEAKENIGQVTYNDMTDGGTKAGVMIFGSHENKGGEYDKYYKLSNFVVSNWLNQTNSKVAIDLIETKYNQMKDHSSDYLYIIQTQLTPSFKGWFDTACGWSVSDMNARHNARVVVDERVQKWLSAFPIYLCDYSTTDFGNFSVKVIAELTEYNLNLA